MQKVFYFTSGVVVQRLVVWWMKRDLRAMDNSALRAAIDAAQSQGAPLVALWITEPESLAAPEYHARREKFVLECFEDLEPRLSERGITLYLAEGPAVDVFRSLLKHGLVEVFSHEETGVLWTFNRDLEIKSLFKETGVQWTECPTNGVVRGLRDRGRWQCYYQSRVSMEPIKLPIGTSLDHLPKPVLAHELTNAPIRFLAWNDRKMSILFREACLAPRQQQKGGETVALKLLQRFLSPDVHKYYVASLSKPRDAQFYSSRLSPYLSFGCLSTRQVLSELSSCQHPLDSRSISAFRSRLAWRCHFVQKLENFPDMEKSEQNSALSQLRPEMSNEEYERWSHGQTGYPLVDASLRSVHQTGFLNFRMRAMLMSFATHLMWRDWRAPAWDLARAFLDFEAGIHFSQVQMQAAVTGNNQIRIYNPLKQSAENDADAQFIKKWVPELRDVSPENIHACENLPATYPQPMFNLKQATSFARERLFKKIKEPEVRAEAKTVQERLGSRGGPLSWRGRSRSKKASRPAQTLFDDE